MGQRRRRRSLNPKFLLAEIKYFDEMNTNSGDVEVEGEQTDDMDNFSFVDDDGSSSSNIAAESVSEEVVSSPLNANERVKRAAANEPGHRELHHFEPYQFDAESDEDISADSPSESNKGGRRKNKGGNRSSTASNGLQKARHDDDNDENKESPLDKLVKDIRQKVKDTKKFWSNLPFQICNGEDYAAPPSSDANCWNGNTIDR